MVLVTAYSAIFSFGNPKGVTGKDAPIKGK
jgi:hypothetical protein